VLAAVAQKVRHQLGRAVHDLGLVEEAGARRPRSR
jgi:hypothetical protein